MRVGGLNVGCEEIVNRMTSPPAVMFCVSGVTDRTKSAVGTTVVVAGVTAVAVPTISVADGQTTGSITLAMGISSTVRWTRIPPAVS